MGENVFFFIIGSGIKYTITRHQMMDFIDKCIYKDCRIYAVYAIVLLHIGRPYPGPTHKQFCKASIAGKATKCGFNHALVIMVILVFFWSYIFHLLLCQLFILFSVFIIPTSLYISWLTNKHISWGGGMFSHSCVQAPPPPLPINLSPLPLCLVHTSISFQHFLLQLPPTISLSLQTSICQVHIYLYVPPLQYISARYTFTCIHYLYTSSLPLCFLFPSLSDSL